MFVHSYRCGAFFSVSVTPSSSKSTICPRCSTPSFVRTDAATGGSTFAAKAATQSAHELNRIRGALVMLRYSEASAFLVKRRQILREYAQDDTLVRFTVSIPSHPSPTHTNSPTDPPSRHTSSAALHRTS